MKYRKRPVVIEARQFEPLSELDAEDVAAWCAGELTGEGLEIHTLEGVMLAKPGDYVIQGVSGEFYPCKPDVFDQTYEPVDDSDAAA